MVEQIAQNKQQTNKWHFQFAWLPTVFYFLFLFLLNNYFTDVSNKALIAIFVFTEIFFVGLLIAVTIRRIPWLELVPGWSIYILVTGNLPNFFPALLIDYILSLFGALLGVFVLKILDKCITADIKEIIKSSLGNEKVKVFIPITLTIILFILLLSFFAATQLKPATYPYLNKSVGIFVLFAGLLMGYVSQKVSIGILLTTYFLASCMIFIAAFICLFESLYYEFIAMITGTVIGFLYYYIGCLAGYRFYLKTRLYFNFESIQDILTKPLRDN